MPSKVVASAEKTTIAGIIVSANMGLICVITNPIIT